MGFRTVIIKNRAKLEFRLNSLIVRGDTEKKIYIGEINTLIIQSTAVSLTASLLNELTKITLRLFFATKNAIRPRNYCRITGRIILLDAIKNSFFGTKR